LCRTDIRSQVVHSTRHLACQVCGADFGCAVAWPVHAECSNAFESDSPAFAMPRHESHDAACAVCEENAGERAMPHGVLWEDDLWLVRHYPPPYAAAGWMTLQAKRHVAGPGFFNDAEAAALGPTLRRMCRAIQDSTGCLRVYVAAMGESAHHFHMHMVPKYEGGPKAWAVFGQAAEAAAGRVDVPEERVLAVIKEFQARLAAGEHEPAVAGAGAQ
jgi:diadenosine tetraphosphate (Ap4A) HIT family hydrolase